MRDKDMAQELDSKSLQKLQQTLVHMIADLNQMCDDNEITYFLMGGTALGAMRHSGFIPWDDDFDIFMDRVNYDKFLAIAKDHLNQEKYYLQVGDTDEWPLQFSKVRLNGTTYFEANDIGRKMHTGIFIDVMCLNNASKFKSLRFFQFLAGRALSAAGLAKRGYATKKLNKVFLLYISNILVRGSIKSLLKWLVERASNSNSEYVGHFSGRASFKASAFPRSLLGKPRYVKFAGVDLPVVERVEEYLTIRYGKDYMKLPSKAVRDAYPPHALSVDFGKVN